MKKLLMLFIIPAILFPVFTAAQFMKDYRPTGSPVISSIVNLVSVVQANDSSRAINTIRESPLAAINDVWVTGVDAGGNVTFSRRYGLAGANETAAALTRCPNGDFIYAATTNTAGILSAWLFRTDAMGNIIWSRRYFAPNNKVISYCIKKTNEPVENYIVAATTNSDTRLLVFKITAAGALLWNRQYVDPVPPPGLADVPKSMILNRDTVIIAGNRSSGVPGAPLTRDIFVIGIIQSTGAITHPYRFINNSNFVDKDPFINLGLNKEYVLTYQCVANFAPVSTGRIAFTRLNSSLGIVGGTSSLLWENNTTNSFGHSIYIGTTTAAGTYDIGGGTTVGNLNNPLFVTINTVGMPVAGSYRRLWTTLNFNSTFMMQSTPVAANRYEHHNFKQLAGQNSMSLLRNNLLAAPCNVPMPIIQKYVQAIATLRTYNLIPLITQINYPVHYFPVITPVIKCQ